MPCKTVQLGYGARHKRLRALWAPRVRLGIVSCARCGQPILRGEAWDLGHDDLDRSVYSGPEHVRCNRAVAGRSPLMALRTSREW